MFHGERHDNFFTFTAVALPHFDNSCSQQLFLWFVEALGVFKCKGLSNATIRDVKVINVCYLFVVLYIEYIDVMEGVADHLALASIVVEKDVLLLQCFSLFELKLCGMFLHLLHQLSLYLGCVSLKYFLCLCDVLHVFLAALSKRAGCLAVFDVIFQTFLMLVLLDGICGNCIAATSEWIEFLNEFQQQIHRWNVTVGTEECSETFVYFACLEYPGQVFISDYDAGVRFPVLQ